MHNKLDPDEPVVSSVDIKVEYVMLTPQGVTTNWHEQSKFQFGAPRTDVENFLTGSLGEPVGRSSNDECGAGPMETTDYSGPLRVNFQDGKLVGWLLQDDGTPSPAMVSGGLGVANTVSDLKTTLEGFALVNDSTLGNEFTSTQGIGGFLDEKGIGVEAFYAGTNCFFR